MSRIYIILALVLVSLFLFTEMNASTDQTASVEESTPQSIFAFAHLVWNESPDGGVVGYRVYYGTSPREGDDPGICGLCGYEQMVDVGSETERNFNSLKGGETYYFSVSAYDSNGNESPFLEEVTKETPVMAADLNGDSRVHSADFDIMKSSWGSTDRPIADINRDGAVDSVDFAVLMSQWTG